MLKSGAMTEQGLQAMSRAMSEKLGVEVTLKMPEKPSPQAWQHPKTGKNFALYGNSIQSAELPTAEKEAAANALQIPKDTQPHTLEDALREAKVRPIQSELDQHLKAIAGGDSDYGFLNLKDRPARVRELEGQIKPLTNGAAASTPVGVYDRVGGQLKLSGAPQTPQPNQGAANQEDLARALQSFDVGASVPHFKPPPALGAPTQMTEPAQAPVENRIGTHPVMKAAFQTDGMTDDQVVSGGVLGAVLPVTKEMTPTQLAEFLETMRNNPGYDKRRLETIAEFIKRERP
jgi:hypothetical protein